MADIIAKLSVVVSAGVNHPPVENMTEDEKKFLGITDEKE